MQTSKTSFQQRAGIRVARATAAAATLLVVMGAAWSADDPASAWQTAEAAYANQHFAFALEAFERLAAQGDARAADLAGQMLFFGECLYGGQVAHDAQRAAVWLAQAAKGGREVAGHLLKHAQAVSRAPAGATAGSTTVRYGRSPIPAPHAC